MYSFLHRRLLRFCKISQRADLGFGLPQSVKNFSSLTTRVSDREKQHSFTVSYLTESCGLTLESAKAAAKKVNLESRKKPDSVLLLLRNHGFTDAQISKFVRSRPTLLSCSVENMLLPKFEFFLSIGMRNDELVRMLTTNPGLLQSSLKNTLTPAYIFMKGSGLSDEDFVRALRGNSWLIQSDLEKTLAPNIALLEEVGVPKTSIPKIIKFQGSSVLRNHEKFATNIRKVIEMGFDPRGVLFIHALQVFASVKDSVWEQKITTLKNWNWSEEQIQAAFRRFPLLMATSIQKMDRTMEFLVNQMGWDIGLISGYPHLLALSSERRLFPRCLVIKMLQLKGLMRHNFRLSTFLLLSEEKFLDMYVSKHLRSVPQLLKIYQGGIDSVSLKLDQNEQ